MSNMDTYRWEKQELGEPGEYPGHPVVLACMVMDRYQDLATACICEPGHDYYNALRDSFIPGTGCAVRAALDTLRFAQESGLDTAYAHAERYWLGWEQQHPSNVPRATHGREQAAHIKGRFEKHLVLWGTPADPGSPYRIQSL